MQLMMKVRHPNLINLLGVVTRHDPLMLVLEFLPGGSLDKWLVTPRPQLLLDDQLYILYQVALGMQALHARGILHRDLAARNVLVGVDLVCKVSDYGLSREITPERDYYRHATNRSVPLRWMAPEVCPVFVCLLLIRRCFASLLPFSTPPPARARTVCARVEVD